MVKIGINGFGRIGRMVLRSCISEGFNVVVINDAFLTLDYMAYLFKYDSTHGNFNGNVTIDDNKLIIEDVPINVYREKNPDKIPWDEYDVDFVIEATGIFTTYDKAALHLNSGGKYVILTAPSLDIPMFIMGVNHTNYNADMRVVSVACSTSNCLAPLAKVLNDNFTIVEGLMMAVHAMTPTQKVVDSPGWGNRREARGAMQNIIPTCSGAAIAIGQIIPELNGKLTGMAMKVPVPDVSVLDLTVRLSKPATYEEIKKQILSACIGDMKGIMAWTDEDVVSSDFIGNPHSCIFDVKSGIPLNNNFVKLIAWYDNEYAYARRVTDMIEYIATVAAAAGGDAEASATELVEGPAEESVEEPYEESYEESAEEAAEEAAEEPVEESYEESAEKAAEAEAEEGAEKPEEVEEVPDIEPNEDEEE